MTCEDFCDLCGVKHFSESRHRGFEDACGRDQSVEEGELVSLIDLRVCQS